MLETLLGFVIVFSTLVVLPLSVGKVMLRGWDQPTLAECYAEGMLVIFILLGVGMVLFMLGWISYGIGHAIL